MSTNNEITARGLLDVFAKQAGIRLPPGLDFTDAAVALSATEGMRCPLNFARLRVVPGVINVPDAILNCDRGSKLWEWLREWPGCILLVRGSRGSAINDFWTVQTFPYADVLTARLNSLGLAQFTLVAGTMPDAEHPCVAALTLDSWPVKQS